MSTLLAAPSGDGTKAGKAIGLALGVGLGALGAGVGIGNIFGSMIQAVARQPELRGELQGIQWLRFALTQAGAFYGLIRGPLAHAVVRCPPPLDSSRASPGWWSCTPAASGSTPSL